MFNVLISRLIDHTPRQMYYYLQGKIARWRQGEILKGFDDGHPCVFVLSSGRAGTKTLAALLSLAKNIIAYHEPKPLMYGLSRLTYQRPDNDPAYVILREAFLTLRKSQLDYSLSCNRGYVETSPQSTFLGPVILKAIPEVKFIHLVRDPRDVVSSGMRRKWYEGHPYDNTRIIPRQGAAYQKEWDNLNSFQKNLWLWNETNRWILDFSNRLSADHRILVHSEDIFGAFEGTIEKIFSFIGSEMPAERKILHILGKKLNAQKTVNFPNPSDWTEDMINDLKTFCGQTAKILGYEL